MIEYLLSQKMVQDNDDLIDDFDGFSMFSFFDYFMARGSDGRKRIHEELIQLCAKYLANNASFRKQLVAENIVQTQHKTIFKMFCDALKKE